MKKKEDNKRYYDSKYKKKLIEFLYTNFNVVIPENKVKDKKKNDKK